MPFEINEVLRDKGYNGLSQVEAERRLKEYGLNARPTVNKKTWLKRLVDIFAEPMMLFLIVAAVVYFLLGDKLETIILLLTIVPIALIELFQESRTDEAIAALDKMMVQFVEVYRDGTTHKIEVKYLVPGDLVYLAAGDRIPADGVLFRSPGLMVDESLLTGESMPVVKNAVTDGVAEINDENICQQGTMVGQGDGHLLVVTTGEKTAYGKLGELLEQIDEQTTPLTKKIRRLVRIIAVIAIATAVLVAIFLTMRDGVLQGILGAITIAMSLIPEEFPIVYSVFLIMGVRRMSKQNALTRQMAMVETLGSATVVCTDKTGTLTEGTMALEKIYFSGRIHEVTKLEKSTDGFGELIRAALLGLEQVAIDPIEIEVQRFARQVGVGTETFFRSYTMAKDSSFDSKTKTVSHIWQDKSGKLTQYTVGAPESIIDNSTLEKDKYNEVKKKIDEFSGHGFRLVAVSERICSTPEIKLENLKFLGFLIMSDPPRAGVKEAIDTCQKAGVRIIMITGDNKLTAHSIAEDIGLKHNEEIMGGEELEKLSPAALIEAVKRHDIFARVRPEHKYMIVEALKQAGEVVAMTGDGVNDAPALKTADIGIAMGKKGTEVARAASGIILMDDNFSTIVKAMSEGRRIYDNLRHAFMFLLSFHLPIVGMAILPIFYGSGMFFYPLHVIFLELFCDPATVLGLERDKARHNIMSDPPRPVNEPLINPRLFTQVFIQGFSILAVSFGFFYFYGVRLDNMELGRTLGFSSMVISQLLLVLFIREWQQVRENKLILFIAGITFVVLNIFLFVPGLNKLLHFSKFTWGEYGLLLVVPFLMSVVVAIIIRKFVKRK